MFTQYIHHNVKMWVIRWLKGKHKHHSLCYQCARFHPTDPSCNCNIAKYLYIVGQWYGVVTPVWECLEFQPANSPHQSIQLKKPFDFEEWLGENTNCEDDDERLIISTTGDEGVEIASYGNVDWQVTGKNLEEACLRFTALKEGK